MAKKLPDKLSVEASKALAAGMSYGKWKALQQNPSIPKSEVFDPEKMTRCKCCGQVFQKNKHYRVCCSDKCRAEYTAAQKREYMRVNRYKPDKNV